MLEDQTWPTYRLVQCKICGACGTIVEMGLCCRVVELDAAWMLRGAPTGRKNTSKMINRKG